MKMIEYEVYTLSQMKSKSFMEAFYSKKSNSKIEEQ